MYVSLICKQRSCRISKNLHDPILQFGKKCQNILIWHLDLHKYGGLENKTKYSYIYTDKNISLNCKSNKKVPFGSQKLLPPPTISRSSNWHFLAQYISATMNIRISSYVLSCDVFMRGQLFWISPCYAFKTIITLPNTGDFDKNKTNRPISSNSYPSVTANKTIHSFEVTKQTGTPYNFDNIWNGASVWL